VFLAVVLRFEIALPVVFLLLLLFEMKTASADAEPMTLNCGEIKYLNPIY